MMRFYILALLFTLVSARRGFYAPPVHHNNDLLMQWFSVPDGEDGMGLPMEDIKHVHPVKRVVKDPTPKTTGWFSNMKESEKMKEIEEAMCSIE